MATDRERAEALFDQIARDLGDRRGIPDIRYDFDEEAHADIRAAIIPMIERALAPTDAEREAMREVVEKARETATAATRYRWFSTDLLLELDAALARLDAATGGRGDG